MENNIIFKSGCWEVNGVIYTNKYEALYNASKTNSTVNFKFNNHIWETFNRMWLGKISLNELYKQRALQIRDKYDYLVLYYSGGSDSHNILRTFVDNNIQLDEVCVKWPKPLREGRFYTPDITDTSAENFWSEWDYSIKPVLEWLTKNTKIKINITDPITQFNVKNSENLIDSIDHDRNVGAMIINEYIVNTSATTGHIYGIDKPLLCIKNNKICMFFSDFPFTTMSKTESSECFYWAPDMPLLTFEMAYQMASHILENKQFLDYLSWNDINSCTQFQNDLAKKICYTTWDFRFQALKPKDSGRNDKFKWVNELTELEFLRTSINNIVSDRKKVINDLFVSKNYFKNFNTAAFSIVDL